MYMNKMQHNYILMNWHLQDMTARDLLQQRYTLPNGDTAWRPSPLVTAALEGKLVILDGIHRINPVLRVCDLLAEHVCTDKLRFFW